MLRFEWNALRPGDEMLVHDDASATMALVPGIVEMVDTQRGDYGIGIRVATGGASRIVWPSSKAVHRGAGAMVGPCWRCESVAAQA